MGLKKPGFSFLELMVAITLLGVVAALVIPRVRKVGPKEQREQFFEKLNQLTKFAWQQAVSSGTVHKVEFDLEKKNITIERSIGKKSAGKLLTEPIKRRYTQTSLAIPPFLQFRNFFVQKVDEIARRAGGAGAVWFFITPDGFSQLVHINLVDLRDRVVGGMPRPIGLVLNPFSVQFQVHSAFQIPDK